MNGPFDDVITETRQNLGRKFKKAAEKIGNDIHHEFVVAMNNFYNDSPNKKYKPKMALYKSEQGVGGDKVFIKQLGPFHYECGLYIDDELVPDIHVRPKSKKGYATLEYVTRTSIDEGIHGFDAGMMPGIIESFPPARFWSVPAKTDPAPATAMDNFVNSIDIDGIVGGVGL